MIADISDSEIKRDLFDIKDTKAHGPDGFTAAFFKQAWSIIGFDTCTTVKEFFTSGKMLGELNATLVYLIPKVQTPDKIMQCVTTVAFTLNVNGDRIGYFKGDRGFKPGDPISPYLFTLIMENFSLILLREIDHEPNSNTILDLRISNYPMFVLVQLLGDMKVNMNEWQSVLQGIIGAGMYSMKSTEEVFKGIMEVIKYKLLGITMKDSKVVRYMEDKWKISCGIESVCKMNLFCPPNTPSNEKRLDLFE
nr:hypothetical protein [Tanacetum cinerariifolium]